MHLENRDIQALPANEPAKPVFFHQYHLVKAYTVNYRIR